MRLDQLINEIQYGEIGDTAFLASTTPVLIFQLSRNERFRDAVDALMSDQMLAHALADFARNLLKKPVPPRYHHPDDLTLATTIVLLCRSNRVEGENLVDNVLRGAGDTFNATRQIARYFSLASTAFSAPAAERPASLVIQHEEPGTNAGQEIAPDTKLRLTLTRSHSTRRPVARYAGHLVGV